MLCQNGRCHLITNYLLLMQFTIDLHFQSGPKQNFIKHVLALFEKLNKQNYENIYLCIIYPISAEAHLHYDD